MAEYLVDTYGAIEYLRNNQYYVKTLKSATSLYVTEFMLSELYYIILRENGEADAEKYFEAFSIYLTRTSESYIKEAMKLRLKLKRQKLDISYSDAIGYQIALSRNIKFLTGDSAFEKLPNVEFIK